MIVRKLWAWEWEQRRSHLLRLHPDDRRLRFCRAASDEFIHRYCDQIDRERTVVIGCFIGPDLRGVAELVRIGDGMPRCAELALSVERPFQNQGIGQMLLRKALLLAQNRFVETMYLLSLRENEKIQRLVRKFGATIDTRLDSSEGRIRVPWPSYLSLIEEATGDGQALIGAVFEVPGDQSLPGSKELVGTSDLPWPR